MTRPSWNSLHFTSAILWAQRSRDPSSQVGCAIVSEDNVPLSYGYNGPPRGVHVAEHDLATMDRETKLMYFEHGERNAIYNAIRTGTSVKGATLYIVGTPCCDCCRAIIQSGITCVKVLKSTGDIWDSRGSWVKSTEATKYMFESSGVELKKIDSPVIGEFNIRIGGKIYTVSGTSIYESVTQS